MAAGFMPRIVKCECRCHKVKTVPVSIACAAVGRHEHCVLENCGCKCHKREPVQLAADGQPNVVETRCSDCFDGKPCMRLLCNWCWDQYGVLGLKSGELKATHEKPRPMAAAVMPQINEAGEDLIDWVRGLNPNEYKSSGATPIKPVGVRPKVKPLSSECGIDPMHHSQCKEEWCKCVCHDSRSEKASLACIAAAHGECKQGWCECKCHQPGEGET